MPTSCISCIWNKHRSLHRLSQLLQNMLFTTSEQTLMFTAGQDFMTTIYKTFDTFTMSPIVAFTAAKFFNDSNL